LIVISLPVNFIISSYEKNPAPLTGKDLNIVTPNPLKNVRIPSSLNFFIAQSVADRYFKFDND
jgi:hypothetical protein